MVSNENLGISDENPAVYFEKIGVLDEKIGVSDKTVTSMKWVSESTSMRLISSYRPKSHIGLFENREKWKFTGHKHVIAVAKIYLNCNFNCNLYNVKIQT